MYRNDHVLPAYALVLSLVLFFIAYLDGRHLAALHGGPLEELSSGQIGLVGFAMVLLIYAVVGFVVVWLEGKEPTPVHKPAKPTRRQFLTVLVTAVVLVAASGVFVQAILYSKRTQETHTALEGVLFGIVALLVATVLALYKHYFQGEDVTTESQDSEVPW
jgi:amino acid transporter